jgi:hypothetical protein
MSDDTDSSPYQQRLVYGPLVSCAHFCHTRVLFLVSVAVGMTDNSYIVIEKRELTVSVAFTAISLFSMLRTPLNIIPTFVRS